MPMKLKVELDFDTAKRAADKASKDIAEGFKSAMESALANKAFLGQRLRENATEIEKFRKNLALKQAALEERERVRKEKADNQTAAKLHALRTKYLEDEAAFQAEMDADRKAELKDQRDETKRLRDLYEEIEQSSERFNDNTQGIVRGLLASAKTTEKLTKRMEAAADAAKDIQTTFDNLSVQNLGENLTDVADKFGDALKNGIDLESMSKDLGKGIGKALGQGMKAIGGGGAGMMAAAGAVAGLVAAIGIFAALMLATDKKVKEFNKDIIKTHGALSALRVGAGDLNKGLNILRRTTMDLQGNLGVTEEEAKGLFDALDAGGYTLSRITGGTQNAAEAQYRLTKAIRETHSVANLMGVTLSEYAQSLTQYVDDLGMSTESVNDNFLQIAKMASESAFSTRRFYSIVTQATSGQSALNVSLAQTGDLLLRMSKIMGMKKAAEMVGGATSDLGSMSAQDRIKANIIAGGAGKRVFEREAHEQARSFGAGRGRQTATQNTIRGVSESLGEGFSGIAEAIQNAALRPDDLTDRLAQLSRDQQQALISGISASGSTPEEKQANAETSRQLNALIQLTRGARGGLSERVAAMGQISAGGSLAFRAAQMQRFVGMRSATMSATDRAAAENVSGMSGTAMDTFLDTIERNRADFQTMIRISQKSAEDRTAAENEQLANLQALHHVTATNGVIEDKSGRILQTGNDLFQTNAEVTEAEQRDLRTQAESLAEETMDATLSIADILENKLGRLLQSVYDFLKGPLDQALGWIMDLIDDDGKEQRDRERKVRTETVAAIDKKIAELSDTKTRRQEMTRLRITSTNRELTKEQRDAAKARLDQLAQEERTSQQSIAELSRIRGTIEEGNTYYTRAGEGQARLSEALGQEITPQALAQAQTTGGYTLRVGGDEVLRFGTREAAEEARRARAPSGGGEYIYDVEETGALSGQAAIDYARRAMAETRSRMGLDQPAAPTPAPTTPATTTPAAPTAPTATPAPARPAPTAPAAPATPAQQARDPGAVATQDAADEQRQRDDRDRRERQRTEQQRQRDNERLLKGKDLGDGLATSRLPDAIAEADAKMRLTEALFKEGKSEADIARILSGENLSPTDRAGTESQNLVKALGLRRTQVQQAQAQNDFIYQNRGSQSIVTPISSQDSVIGAKPGGALSNLAGRAGGAGNVNIHINGGDERRVFEVVKRAIQQAGIAPTRVPAGGT